MPVKTTFITEDRLRSTPLPNHGGKYAVVSHGDIIDNTRQELQLAGFTIDKELYKTSIDGQIAQGVYHLNYGNDVDMGLMFAWSNSYNKMMRFKCAIGAQVFICMNGVVAGDLANYNRKHIGTSTLQDVYNTINFQISKAKEYYTNLVADKEMLKQVILTKGQQGEVIGNLFINKEVLSLTQVGIIKREIDKPSFTYNTATDSAWALYNHITLALKESHPMHYLDDHKKVHGFFVNQFGQLVTTTNQLYVDPIDEEDDTDVREDLVVSPAGSDFDLDVNSNPYLVNFL